jgi:heme/copper-type cytochrome/quinol oxidase subunit 4
MIDIILPAIFLATLIYYLYLKRQKKKGFIVITGLMMTIITIVLFISAICTILNFIFNYII